MIRAENRKISIFRMVLYFEKQFFLEALYLTKKDRKRKKK